MKDYGMVWKSRGRSLNEIDLVRGQAVFLGRGWEGSHSEAVHCAMDGEDSGSGQMWIGWWQRDCGILTISQGVETPRREEVNLVPFWVRIYGVPLRRMMVATAGVLGQSIGGVVAIDAGEGRPWSMDYLKVKVEVDVRRPLMRGRRVLLEDGSSIWVSFRYERRFNFCYTFGLLDHVEWDCDVNSGMGGGVDKQFGEWRRVPRLIQQPL
ncbi:hypothetical protein SLEP1_g29584 [Rubroshorea leprosula]|uniref:Zinc knuckle CX2CX4HX4C domain-containing protein n=1 Tax=Rubroshorea leprosula TaxID=152421 RepID=A0AAV5K3G7_9ROSI|nr:hypothetical protein SLEP1_g29584 [Rubroshorea leprosula]